MTPQEENEAIAAWAGIECRCEMIDPDFPYLSRCPRHSNNGNPPDYDRDEVAVSLLNTLADKGYWPHLVYDDDGHWQVSTEGSTIRNTINLYANPDLWQPTIASAIKRSILALLEKEQP